jgi:hypothetical protein
VIKQGSHLSIARIPLEDLRIFEHQVRYPKMLKRYLRKLKKNKTDDLGVIHVKPRDFGYEVLDGHHRFVALVMSGRTDALCLIIDESHLNKEKNR